MPKPAYKSYRLFNPTAGGCDQIGELKLYGQQVLDVSVPQAILSVAIVDTSDDSSTVLSQQVTYDTALTSYLTLLEPRWGSVEGGTAIVMQTTDFGSNNPADVTVLIDGVECDVTLAMSTII